MELDDITEDEKTRRGQLIAEILRLRKDKKWRGAYGTNWGPKSALGIYETVAALIIDGRLINAG